MINNSEDFFPIELTVDDVLFKKLLFSPEELIYGDGQILDNGCKARMEVGKKPIIKNLRKLYEIKNTELPADLKIFNFYDIWIITYSLGIITEGTGLKKIRQIQFDIEYTDDTQNQPDVTIVDMLPQTKFTTLLQGGLSLNANVSLSGEMSFSEKIVSAIASEQLGVNGSISVSGDLNAVCSLAIKLVSSEITSIGIGNYNASWVLERSDDNLLLGDQLLIQTILVPKDLPYINCRIKVSSVCTAPFGLFPLRLKAIGFR